MPTLNEPFNVPLILHEQMKIHRLIQDCKLQYIQRTNKKLDRAESFKQTVVLAEIDHELSFLEKILDDSNNFKQAFIQRCKDRELTHQDTALSFTAAPSGAINTLYWKIAIIIGKPKDLGEILSILLPSVKTVLNLNATRKPECTSKLTVVYSLVKTNLQENNFAGSLPENLTEFIISKGTLLPVGEVAHLPLKIHLELFPEFTKQYPELTKKLFNHNQDFQTLSNEINKINRKLLPPPRQAIQTLINELKRSGWSVTNRFYATEPAYPACADFRRYLDQLTKEEQEKLLSLDVTEFMSIDNVLKSLANGNCVEAAASHLVAILNNRRNASVLDDIQATSGVTQEEKKALEIKKNLLTPEKRERVGQEKSDSLPVTFFENVLENDDLDFLQAARTFLPTCYIQLGQAYNALWMNEEKIVESLIILFNDQKIPIKEKEKLEKLVKRQFAQIFKIPNLVCRYPQIFSQPKFLKIVLTDGYENNDERLKVIRYYGHIHRVFGWEIAPINPEILKTILDSFSDDTHKKIILRELSEVNLFYKHNQFKISTAVLLLAVGIITAAMCPLLIPLLVTKLAFALLVITPVIALISAFIIFSELKDRFNKFQNSASTRNEIKSLADRTLCELYPEEQRKEQPKSTSISAANALRTYGTFPTDSRLKTEANDYSLALPGYNLESNPLEC